MGPCYVCRTSISIWDFECGHVVAESNGGETTLNNLRPICGVCNKSMGTMDLEEYKKTYFSHLHTLDRYYLYLRGLMVF